MLKNFTCNIYQQVRQKHVLSNACERYCKVQFPICYSTVSENTYSKVLDIQHDASSISCDDKPTKDIILQDMLIYNDFITEEEEKSLFNEVEPYLKRMRYEYNHWDNVSVVPHRNRLSSFFAFDFNDQQVFLFINAPLIYHSRPYTDTEKQKGVGGLRTISAFCRKLRTLLFHLANHR